MSLGRYLKDRGLFFFIHSMLFFIIASIMFISGWPLVTVILLCCLWFLPLMSYVLWEFRKGKKFYDEVVSLNEGLEKKYLLSEVIDPPHFIEGEIFYRLLKEGNRNMRETVNHYREQQQEYREYIETWVHEIKTPIASMNLIIENHQDYASSSIQREIRKVEDYIEQVLYYARSDEVSQDYMIRPFDLEDVIRKTIRRNAKDCIQKGIGIEIGELNKTVYSDPKWVEFILHQVVSNSIKYTPKGNRGLLFTVEEREHQLILMIIDHGIGIEGQDLGRVFEKGFTGENGRIFGRSTGMGLYLCKKLCDKLGLGLQIDSTPGAGTTVMVIFPVGKLHLM